MGNKLLCHCCNLYKDQDCFSDCKKAKLRNGKSYVCKECQAKQQRERRNKKKKADILDFTLKKRLYDAINRAKLKNQYFDIDIDFMYQLWNEQKGLCALTGIPMTATEHGRINTNVSIDRIDSSKGYTKGNVQLVCSAINFMKTNLKMSDFLFYCKAVTKYNSN